ncbi:amidotransferase [Oleiphilus messinensis]|uniref:Amidotransferase n=1 Tax=Oleiphilus messinensis TaxID=141451 RepID=A0A1Y0IDN6_9GAMM|nr:hypothetical protein [Oleiphilus messinensis]ARU58632.1 amidotransferase [Oleiphilus messinensis]
MNTRKTIAIIDCDYLYDHLKDEYHSYPEMFARAAQRCDLDLEFCNYSAIDEQLPSPIPEMDGWVIMGSKFGAYEDRPWINALKAFIRTLYERGDKITGVCFGHQIIHLALGGEVRKASVGWGVGVHDYELDHSPEWLPGARSHLSLIVSHQDQVIRMAPRAKRIAGSAFCPNAICLIDEQVLTCQAHPEFTPDYSRQLMNIRRTCIGEQIVQNGEQSLSKELHSAVVLNWFETLFKRG